VLAPAAAGRWPALRGTRWRMPVGDGACACIGSGCTGPTQMALTVGTSAAVRVLGTLAPGAAVPPGVWLYRLDRRHSLFGAASSNGGSVRQWLLRTLQLPPADTLDALLAARPAAAHGVSFLPFLAGERSPDWPLDASALLAGLRLGNTPLDILQAAMEGVAYRLALLVGRLRAVVPEATTIVASGAALERSPFWTQLVADAIGERIQLCMEPEATCRGAALLALVGTGVLSDAGDAIAPGTVTIEPDAGRHARHEPAMQRLAALDAAASDLRGDPS
jgi:gluconokinase